MAIAPTNPSATNALVTSMGSLLFAVLCQVEQQREVCPCSDGTSEGDIVCKGLAQDSFDASRTTARDVMTPGIHCCRDDDDLAKAVRHMEKLQVRRLPVV